MRKHPIRRLLVLLAVVSLLLPAVRASDLSLERKIFDFLTGELGLNSAAACGVLANIEAESGFRLENLGDSGTSFGLCQWHNSRYEQLKSFCIRQGYDYRTAEGQLNYLAYELRTQYQRTYAILRGVPNTSDGAYTAGYYWCYYFEVPATREESSLRRGRTAQLKYWVRYGGMGGSGEVEVDSRGYSGLLSQSIVSQYSFYWDEEEPEEELPELTLPAPYVETPSRSDQPLPTGQVRPFRFRYVSHHYNTAVCQPVTSASCIVLSGLFLCAGPAPEPVPLPEPEECAEKVPEEAAGGA